MITGEGAFDFSSRSGKVPYGVATIAAKALQPCIALAGQVLVGSREMRALGVESAYSMVDLVGEEASFADPAGSLAALAERTAKHLVALSPPRGRVLGNTRGVRPLNKQINEPFELSNSSGSTPMTEQVDTTTETQVRADGINVSDAAASKVKSLLEQEGRDDLAAPHRRAARRLLRPALPAVLRRAHPRR